MTPSTSAASKFDPNEQFRHEIEHRTVHGETCEQIASALRAKGLNITNKTVSRRRVQWGLRKRDFSKSASTKAKVTRPKSKETKSAHQLARKAEIEARTQRGETAEQIAAALEAHGYELKKGASSILRLQTQWGLIPRDTDRAKGRRRKGEVGPDGERVSKMRSRKVSKGEMEKEANEQQQTQTMHYPTNCSFGPKKRINGSAVDSSDDDEQDFDSAPGPLNGEEDYPAAVSGAAQTKQSSVNIAAEIMSVDFLVDLATSTLGAANNLKDLVLAYQAQRPVPNSASASPPTLEDLSTARRKVREAAAVMHDLAVDPVAN